MSRTSTATATAAVPAWLRAGSALAGLALLAACGSASSSDSSSASTATEETPAYQPVEITNCGDTYRFEEMPERVVASSTIAAELVLALGRGERLAGTVAATDIVEEYAAELEGVPVIAESAFPPPSKEVVYQADPDFVVSGYPDDYGPEAMGDRAALRTDGVNSYLASGNCGQGHKATIEDTFHDIVQLGAVFDAEERAGELVAELRARVEAVEPAAPEDGSGSGEPVRVFDLGGGTEQPFTSGSHALVDDLIARAGGENIFPEVTSFAQVNWEDVIDRDPEAILIEDQAFEPADAAIAYLTSNPALAEVTAVRDERFIVIPVNDTQPGIRVARALEAIAAGLRA